MRWVPELGKAPGRAWGGYREAGKRAPAGDALDKGVIAGYEDGAYNALIGPLRGGLHHVLPKVLTSQAGRVVYHQHRRAPPVSLEPGGCLSQSFQCDVQLRIDLSTAICNATQPEIQTESTFDDI